MAVKYCPVAGQFKDCTGCPNFQCMDFFLYVIEDAKTAEDVRFILVNLKKLLVNQTKTTIILDSFGSKLIPCLNGKYDYIIAQNMQGSRFETALNIILRQSKRAILVINHVVSGSTLDTEIKSVIKKSCKSDHLIAAKPIPVKFMDNAMSKNYTI